MTRTRVVAGPVATDYRAVGRPSSANQIAHRRLLAALTLALCAATASPALGKSYYVSAAGSDASDGLSGTTPWKSVAKVNAAALVAGDAVLFNSGDTFYGTLTPTTSGITFGAYGAGAKPTITGFSTISAWTAIGGNLWEAVVPQGLASLKMVVMGGVAIPMGRYPNASAANRGYLSFESHVDNVSITDAELTGAIDWTGAELVARCNPWTTYRYKITSHSGSTLSFSNPAGATPVWQDDMGYFIENHLSTLDQDKEWAYDAVTHKIRMYYAAGPPPSIEAATLTNLVTLVYSAGVGVKSNITFKGLAFTGSEGIALYAFFTNNLTIDDCDFRLIGETAIFHRYVIGLTVKNSRLEDVNMAGIYKYDGTIGSNVTIENNTLKNIGVFPGMLSTATSYPDSGAYPESVGGTGIYVQGPNVLVEGNVVDGVGYGAILIGAGSNNQIVRKNLLSNFTLIKNDGGAIYSGGLRGRPVPTDYMVIESNIIFKSGNAGDGTPWPNDPHTRGIYLDATSAHVKLLGNTVFQSYQGIYISQAQDIIIQNNTLYDTTQGALALNDSFDGFPHTIGNVITDNVFFAKYPDQILWNQTDTYSGGGSLGMVDRNYYVNPSMAAYPLLIMNYGPNYYKYSLAEWQMAHPTYEMNGHLTPMTTPPLTPAVVDDHLVFYYNPSDSPEVRTFPGLRWVDAMGTFYDDATTVPAWGSRVLIAAGAAMHVDGGVEPDGGMEIDASVVPDKTLAMNDGCSCSMSAGTGGKLPGLACLTVVLALMRRRKPT